MASYPRSMLPLAAAVAAVSLLAIASPASAAGTAVAAEAAGTRAASAIPGVRHRTSQHIRHARNQHRYVQPAPDCAGGWCRRHFVLMVGIAY